MSRYVQSLEAEYHYILQYGVNIFCILIAVVGPHDAGGGNGRGRWFRNESEGIWKLNRSNSTLLKICPYTLRASL